MSNNLVTKSNHLVEAGYKLSLNEQRLILFAISKLDSRTSLPKGNDFTVTASEFSESFNMPIKQAYEVLEKATSRLYNRDIKSFDKDLHVRERFRWVDCVKYWDGDAKVTLSFSNKIVPYLTKLHRQFTSYELKQVSGLKTAYSIRFYELLMQFIKTGERYITIEKLRDLLELKNEYVRFFNLKMRVIEPSIKNINESTDLLVDWDIVKKGKFITGLTFLFQEKHK